MSFGSAATTHIPEPRHPFGLQPQRTPTNERARPVTYFAGTQRFGLTWLGPAYNQRTEEVEAEGGGKGGKGGDGEEQIVGYDYFADVAGLVCLGPVDGIREIWIDDERVWRGSVMRDGDSADITIEERGRMTIYWGTATQPPDAILQSKGHPAYRGQCYVVFEQLYFGQDRTQAPSVELVLVRAPESPLTTPRWIDADANPVHVAAEWITNKRWGLGLPNSALDIPQLDNVAMRVAWEGLGISPVISDQTSVREALLKLCEYIDAYPTFRAGQKFQLRLNRPVVGSVREHPLVGEFDLVEQPKWGSEGWHETVSHVAVNFTDRGAKYEADSEEAVFPATQAVVGEPVKQTLDRPWITRRALAYRVAYNWGLLNSVPLLTAKLRVRRNLVDDELHRRGDEIQAGGMVRFTSAAFQQTILCRVIRKRISDDRSQIVDLDVETDRYYAAVLNYTPDDVPVPGDEDAEGARSLLAARIIEVPATLAADDPGRDNLHRPNFGLLASRRSHKTTHARILFSRDGTSYRRIKVTQRGYILYGTLADALPVGQRFAPEAVVTLNIPPEVVNRNWPSTDEDGLWRGELLAVIGNEYIAFREAQVISTTQVELRGIIRCRYGVFAQEHAAGAQVWVLKARALDAFDRKRVHPDDVVYWKVVPGSKAGFVSAADVPFQKMTVVNHTARPLGPANLVINGAAESPFTYPSGGDLTIDWHSRHFFRHDVWHSFDDPFNSGTLEHRVYLYDAAGTEVYWSKVKDSNKVKLADGAFRLTLNNAALQTIFGLEPNWFTVRVFAKQHGLLSNDFLEARVARADFSVTARASGALRYQPSLLRRTLYTTNPEPLIQANFDRIVNTLQVSNPGFALPHPQVEGSHARQARKRVRENFSAIAAEMAITLHDVSSVGAQSADWAVEANWELINASWPS